MDKFLVTPAFPDESLTTVEWQYGLFLWTFVAWTSSLLGICHLERFNIWISPRLALSTDLSAITSCGLVQSPNSHKDIQGIKVQSESSVLPKNEGKMMPIF